LQRKGESVSARVCLPHEYVADFRAKITGNKVTFYYFDFVQNCAFFTIQKPKD